MLPSDKLAKMNIQGQLTAEEIPGALNFNPNTSQVLLSNTSGVATWKFTVATFVNPGMYYLVILMDWNGKHYNWSWANITIKQED